MDTKLSTVLKYLHHDIKPAIDVMYAQDCCIAATRITLDVLEYFEIPAKELVTQLFVYNSCYREYVERTKEIPKVLTDPKMYSIGLGLPNPTKQPTKGKGFCGHLVAYIEEGYLIDLSITQAHRPRHKIYLEPLILKVGPDFFSEGGSSFRYPQKDGGDLVLDYVLIENEDYKNSTDWVSGRRKSISIMAVAAIEEYLQHGSLQGEEAAQGEQAPAT